MTVSFVPGFLSDVAGRTDKQYSQENKEKIKEYQSQKITCVCGSIHRKIDKARHMKTSKHTNFLKSGSETLLTLDDHSENATIESS